MARRNPSVFISGGVILFITLTAVAAPLLSSFDPEMLDPVARLLPPSRDHLLGTDRYGRDLFSRVLYGGRISLTVAWIVTGLVLLIGGAIGLLAGFSRRIDSLLMRIMDAFMAFPDVVLAIGLMAALGSRLINVVIALTIVYVPRMARVVRSSALIVSEQLYVEAATAMGQRQRWVLLRHVLPGTLQAAMVQATVTFALAVLAEAALSFLGVGLPPATPSWGNIISEGRLYIRQAAWILIYPGIAISLTVIAVNSLGDGLRDLLDPHMQAALKKEGNN